MIHCVRDIITVIIAATLLPVAIEGYSFPSQSSNGMNVMKMRRPNLSSVRFSSRKIGFLSSSFLQREKIAQLPPFSSMVTKRNMKKDGDGEDNDLGRHSYVEGLKFDDREAEILAMGGDPFFMTDDDDGGDEADDQDLSNADDVPSLAMMAGFDGGLNAIGNGLVKEEKWSVTDGKGPRPRNSFVEEEEEEFLEWDGQVDETAYFDD